MFPLLIVIIGSIGLGFFMIFLLALADKKNPRRVATTTANQMTFIQFQKVCYELIEAMKLEIDEIYQSADNQIDIRAHNPTPFVGGEFLVQCCHTPTDEMISATRIIEFSNIISQEKLSKGIFITTGQFTDEISSIGELSPIEFIDGKKVKKLMEQYRITLTST